MEAQTQAYHKDEKITKESNSPVKQVEPVYPIFDRKTGALFFPFEKRYMKVLKDEKELTVEYMHTLARDRMQIKAKNISLWKIGDKFRIEGKGLAYICIVKSIRKRKIVIQKIDQILEKPEELKESEQKERR